MNWNGAALTAFLFMVILNVSTMMINESVFDTGIADGLNVTQVQTAVNLTEGIEGWDWSSETSRFYDVGYGLLQAFKVMKMVLVGFAPTLVSFGFPSWFVGPAEVLWLILEGIFLYLGVIGGRSQ